ncbi:MAG TPA: periplasmic heavy metal sensor [Thermoanaerobaculia bacterium]
MKRNRIFLIVTVVALAFALAAFAQAGRMGQGTRGAGLGQPPAPGQGPFGSPQWLATYLGLSEAQIAQWQAIRDGAQARIAPLLETRKANILKLQEELAKTNPDPATVGSYVIQNHAIGAQIRSIHEAAQAEFVKLLTAEQLAKYNQWLEFRKSMPRRGGQGEGGPLGGFGAGMGFGQGGGFGPGDGTCPCCED